MVIRHNKRKNYMAPAWLVFAFMAAVVMLVALPCRANKVKHTPIDEKQRALLQVQEYIAKADCYESQFSYDAMLKCSQDGYKLATLRENRLRLLRNIGYAAFMLGKYKIFDKVYLEFVYILRREPVVDSAYDTDSEMAILHLISIKQFDKAKKAILAFPDTKNNSRERMWIEYNRLAGNYEEMVKAQTAFFRANIRKQDSLRSKQFEELNSRYINQKLEYQNQQLEMEHQRLLSERQGTELKNTNLKLANTQLTLKNSSLELDREKSASDLLKLSYDNKQLEAKKLLDQYNAEMAQRRLHHTMVISAFAIGVLVLITVLVYIYNRRKMTQRLREANKLLKRHNNELVTAKEKAETADRVKTVFIQNMSHEIRTPLNAIMGFSELIAGDDGSMPQNTRDDFGRIIKNNSDSIKILVADILDTAQLESGTYELRYRSSTVGDICRMAMVAVEQYNIPEVGVGRDWHFRQYDGAYRREPCDTGVVQSAYQCYEEHYQGQCSAGLLYHRNIGMLTFSVTDTGIGVPVDKREDIFKSFVKLDQFKPGLGLGLHICSIIADLLKGKLYLDTEYIGGARFVFAIKV